jgi:hypothetical protein
MTRAALLLLLVAPVLVAAKRPAKRPAPPPTVLAVCTEIKGKVFGVSPRHGWDNDRLPGALTFVRTAAGRVEILSNDRTAVAPGSAIRLTHHSRDFSYFILTAAHQQARVDTWQVTFEPDGRGRLLWSTMVSHMPPTDTTQGALYTATCTR